jgi:hypothetical protein
MGWFTEVHEQTGIERNRSGGGRVAARNTGPCGSNKSRTTKNIIINNPNLIMHLITVGKIND